MLKMGTYGMLRFCLPMFPSAARACAPWIVRAGHHRHHLRRAGRHGAAEHEEAGGVLVGEPPGLRRARHLLLHAAGPRWRGLPDAEPRHLDRRAVRCWSACCTSGAIRWRSPITAAWRRVAPWLSTVFLITTLASIGLPTAEQFRRRVPGAAGRGAWPISRGPSSPPSA